MAKERVKIAAIKNIRAYEILTGTGRPTVEVELTTSEGLTVTASAPSGTSRGGYEAAELTDCEPRYAGRGVRKAADNVNSEIAPAFTGKMLNDPAALDRVLLELDGTPDKRRLGGNAILPVSAAVYKAAAVTERVPLYRMLGPYTTLPSPIATVIAGGAHASGSSLEIEDFICVAHGFSSFSEGLEAIATVRADLELRLRARYADVYDTGGALSGPFGSNRNAIMAIIESVDSCGYAGRIGIGLDVAANELFDPASGCYGMDGEKMDTDRMLAYFSDLCKDFPVMMIEDPFEENDYDSFHLLKRQSAKALVVGDDLYASNRERLENGVAADATHAVLLKVNQIGTITQALETADFARKNGQDIIVSLRSNDTCDPLIADLAVGIGAKMIKLGSPVRGERVAKYNRLLSIEDSQKRGGTQ